MADEPDDDFSQAFSEHVTRYIGPVVNAFHEVQPHVVQLDLVVVGATEERPFQTLITCGMSERAMRIPIENPDDLGRVPELRHAELLLCLPPDWPLTPEAFQDEQNYWPVRWLKRLARLPHVEDSWLGLGHTVPNGDPPEPFAADVGFCCWLIDQPLLFPKELQKLRYRDRVINFYSIVPLYADEMNMKLRKGSGALGELLDRARVTELIQPGRKNLARMD